MDNLNILQATEALAQWQSMRALPPEDRIEALMANFFLPPSETDLEFEITMRAIAEQMECKS